MNLSRRFAALLAPILTALLLAACSGPPTPSTTTSMPRSTTRTSTPPQPGPTPTTTEPRISSFLVQAASFVTAENGYVLGVAPCPARVCLAVRHTSDRGQTWTSFPAPATTLESNGAGVSDLHFADPLDGWAFDPDLWATHDGGHTWHALTLGGPVLAVASGVGVAYALVESCVPSSTCTTPGHLYRTLAGEDSWSEVSGISGRLDVGPFGLVVEGRTVFLIIGSPNSMILSSSDGRSFAPLTVPCAEPGATQAERFSPSAIAASDPSDVTVVCLDGVGAGNQLKQAYVSHDGGHAYVRLPDPPSAGDGAQLAMPSAETVLLGASSGATLVYRSNQPGESWGTALEFPGGIGLEDLAFVDPSHGSLVSGPVNALFASGELGHVSGVGRLELSDDAGATWRVVSVPS